MFTGYKRAQRTCVPIKIIDDEDGFIPVTLFLDDAFEFYSLLLYLLSLRHCSRHCFVSVCFYESSAIFPAFIWVRLPRAEV